MSGILTSCFRLRMFTIFCRDLRMNRCKQKVKETAFYDATTLAFCEKKGASLYLKITNIINM
jgi:hypothetical protein